MVHVPQRVATCYSKINFIIKKKIYSSSAECELK